MADWTTLISSLGAAVIGSVLAPMFSQRRERVVARAEVRKALAEVESRRWPSSPYLKFTRALATFEACALMAGISRRDVTAYSTAVEDYRQVATYEEQVGPDGEDGWVMTDVRVADAHVVAVERLSRRLWHPWLANLR